MSTPNEKLKNFYAEKNLPAEDLEFLIKKIRHRKTGKKKKYKSRQSSFLNVSRHPFKWAAGLTFVSILSWWLVTHQGGGLSGETTSAHKLVEEIVMNHNKHLDVEFSASSFTELGKSMEKLDFWLANPGDRLEDFGLLGGRYCTLQGNLAAQIKLVGSDKAVRTLLVTGLSGELSRVKEFQEILNGVRVSVWKESGLMYALAENVQELTR